MYSLPEDNRIETRYLSQLFSNMSECYKLFWFQAIVNVVTRDKKQVLTYDELTNEMIADAWYMVSEYKLNLGPNDTLEKLIHYAYEKGHLKTSATSDNIIGYLSSTDDKYLRDMKRTLTKNVPYRLQAPFMYTMKGKAWNVGEHKLADRINQEDNLIYYFETINSINSTIRISDSWCDYIDKNQAILRGWITYNMIEYLQKRNPNVPGIVNKLRSPQKRDLKKVTNLWKTVVDISPTHEIFDDRTLEKEDVSIDHFIPWTYVTHDELWNLHPTTKSINSMKSNNMGTWDLHFNKLVDIEYHAYQLQRFNDKIQKQYNDCIKYNVNDDSALRLLYSENLTKQEFANGLEDIMKPVYQSALNLGFKEWHYER